MYSERIRYRDRNASDLLPNASTCAALGFLQLSAATQRIPPQSLPLQWLLILRQSGTWLSPPSRLCQFTATSSDCVGAAWRDVDVLKKASAGTYSIAEATGRRYLVTGASGNLGTFVVELLHRRGERHIYCMDISPLPKTLTSFEGVHFVKCDITDAYTHSLQRSSRTCRLGTPPACPLLRQHP